MEEYRKSLYAINKVSKNIVYKNADGSFLEVTFEKIAEENPNFTAEDFAKLKELSDELFHDEAKNDYVYHNHVTSDLNDNLNSDWVATLALEDEMMRREDDKQFKAKLKEAIDTVLTPTQRRRFLMYHMKNMTMAEIASFESCSINSIKESMIDAQRKIMDIM